MEALRRAVYGRRVQAKRPRPRASGTDAAGYMTESPEFSTFVNDDGAVYHTYSTTWRSLEFLMSYNPILDHAPKGRDEGEAARSTPAHRSSRVGSRTSGQPSWVVTCSEVAPARGRRTRGPGLGREPALPPPGLRAHSSQPGALRDAAQRPPQPSPPHGRADGSRDACDRDPIRRTTSKRASLRLVRTRGASLRGRPFFMASLR
jgi:Bacterial protein of unknown function (DUF899)